MVKIFTVKSVCADDSKEHQGVHAPNRFHGNSYDRSVFDDESCDFGENCKCYQCDSKPVVVLSRGESSSSARRVALRNLQTLVERGLVQPLSEDSFFIYSQADHAGNEQFGVLAAIDVEDCRNNVVKRHENVIKTSLPGKHLIRESQCCAVDPVLLMYRESAAVSAIVRRIVATSEAGPLLLGDGSSAGRQQLWPVGDEADVGALRAAFEEVDSLYIADGHHRTAAACDAYTHLPAGAGLLRSSGLLAAVLFPHTQLRVLPYHRCVRSLYGLSEEAFLSKLAESFAVRALDHPRVLGAASDVVASQCTMHMYLPGRWLSLTKNEAAADHMDAAQALPEVAAQVLWDLVLAPLLLVEAAGREDAVQYVDGGEGLDGLQSRVDGGHAAAAFALPAVTVEQIMLLADRGALLPPKATFFSPKPRPGMMLRLQH